MRLLRHLLEDKPSGMISIHPDASVLDAIKLMAQKSIGALLVIDETGLVGIVSERDYARKVILMGRASESTAVRDIMSADLITARSADSIQHGLNVMTDRRIRHLPVVDDGELRGIVSIGDLVAAIIAEQQAEIEQLGEYITS